MRACTVMTKDDTSLCVSAGHEPRFHVVLLQRGTVSRNEANLTDMYGHVIS